MEIQSRWMSVSASPTRRDQLRTTCQYGYAACPPKQRGPSDIEQNELCRCLDAPDSTSCLPVIRLLLGSSPSCRVPFLFPVNRVLGFGYRAIPGRIATVASDQFGYRCPKG